MNTEEIKNHMNAIRQTRQITNAMYLLSASRMRQTAKKIDYNISYTRRLKATIRDIMEHANANGKIRHPYLDGHPCLDEKAALDGHSAPKEVPSGDGEKVREREHAILYVVIAGDKGLCGSYNHAVLRFAQEIMEKREAEAKEAGEIVHSRLAAIGLVCERHFDVLGREPEFRWREVIQNPQMFSARAMTALLTEEYNEGRADEVYVVYTNYLNAMTQEPALTKLLPLSAEDFSAVPLEYEYPAEMEFVPSPREVFSKVVPQFLVALLFNALIQSSISENAARMNAMQTATTTADEMLEQLQFEFNQQRQLAITNEITEIAAATATIEEKAI